MRIVDLCAAPGGKSAQFAAAGAQVTTVDRSAERLKLLAANFERLRLRPEIVVADALAYEAPPFDAALIDAPCSATGTIRRHPDVAWIKRAGDIAALIKLQTQLLDKAIALTRAGGTIVYCACSLEPEEGEAQIAAVLRRNPDVRRSPIGLDEVGGLAECLTPRRRLAHATLPSVERRPATLRARRLLRRSAREGGITRREALVSSEEGKRTLPVFAEPFGAGFGLVLGLIVVIPGPVFRRERLGGNLRPPSDAAVGR